MSLISREAILKDLRHDEELADHFAATADFVCGYLSAISDFSAQVENAPAVDAEPVEYSMWLEHAGSQHTRYWTCLKCDTLGSPRWKRCPVCEAKMRGNVNA